MFLIIGVVIIPFGVAGTFIIVADAFIYGLATQFEKITLSFVGLLLAMALAVELVESFLGALLAKKFGGSKWGMAGAIIGGFLGAVIGTPITPVLGTLLGGFIGAFIGALSLEWVHTSDWHNALKVGFGAFLGALGGKVTKIVVAIIMVIMIGVRVF
ncbi:DUF456 domain-containing protein [bacterium]|nr:DUF456 domain-containing protein [bacterium]